MTLLEEFWTLETLLIRNVFVLNIFTMRYNSWDIRLEKTSFMYRKQEARRKFSERRTWTYRASCWDRRCGDQDSRRPISCARPLPRPWTRSSGDVSVAPSGSSGPCCLDGTSSLPRESARCLVDTPATDRKPARTCPRVAVALDRSTFLVSENPFPIFHVRFVFFNLQYRTFNSWSFILDLGSVVIDSRLPILLVLFYNCDICVSSYFYKYSWGR